MRDAVERYRRRRLDVSRDADRRLHRSDDISELTRLCAASPRCANNGRNIPYRYNFDRGSFSDNGRCVAGRSPRYQRRNVRKNAASADQIFRHQRARRYNEPIYERYRYAQTDDLAEPYPDVLVSYHSCDGVLRNDLAQSDPHSYRNSHRSTYNLLDEEHCGFERKVLHEAADLARRGQRIY